MSIVLGRRGLLDDRPESVHFSHMFQNVKSVFHPCFAKITLKFGRFTALVLFVAVQCGFSAVRTSAKTVVLFR